MAIKLTKPIRRELSYLQEGGRSIIVEISPGDIISFRPKGRKKSVEVSLGHCFVLAQIVQAQIDYKKRLNDYHNGQKYSFCKKIRKPKAPVLPFSKFYFKAIK